MKHAGIKKVTPIIAFAGVCCCLVAYNLVNNQKFFEASFTTIVSIVIAVVVSYCFVQRKNDERRKKEKLDKLVYKIQSMILDDEIASVDSEEIIRKNFIRHRSLGNKIQYLKDYKTESIEEYVEKLEDNFKQFREFYSDHHKEKEYMINSVKEIANFKARIDDTCDKIHMILM